MKGQLGSAVSAVPASTPRRADVIEKLNDLVDRLDELKDNTAFDESQKERLFNELERELMSAGWGRRDAQWALAGAIRGARRFIYIESPGFAATQKDYGSDPTPPYAADLVELLGTRLTTAPGLRVVMCTPKHPDHAAGYGAFAAQEVADRKKKTLELPTASDFGSRSQSSRRLSPDRLPRQTEPARIHGRDRR